MRPRYELTKSLLDGIVSTLPADNPYTFTLAIAQAVDAHLLTEDPVTAAEQMPPPRQASPDARPRRALAAEESSSG